VLGVGAAVVSKSGGSAAGLTAVSGFLPIAGTAIGAAAALRLAKRLNKQKKRRRR
jgi:hypothetical protein